MLKRNIWANFQRIIEFFTQKIVTKLSKYGFGIRDPRSGKKPFRIPDPGVKKAPDPGSGSATQVKALKSWPVDICQGEYGRPRLHTGSAPPPSSFPRCRPCSERPAYRILLRTGQRVRNGMYFRVGWYVSSVLEVPVPACTVGGKYVYRIGTRQCGVSGSISTR